VFAVDRFKFSMTQSSKGTGQQSSTAPIGFVNSLLFTSSSAYSVVSSDQFAIAQIIEGLNVSDLAWGTASATTVTLSFWVRSSLTGTFGGAVQNSAANRSYPFVYTISAANTFEQKTITIPGDTSGTWLTTNGVGLRVFIGLGMGSTFSGTAGSWVGSNIQSTTGATSVVGTNGATFYITGVQLEAGSVASPFERIDYGRQLIQCQRYFQKTYGQNGVAGSTNTGQLGAIWASVPTTNSYPTIGTWNFAVLMRAAPAVIGYNPNTGASGGFIGDSTSYTPLAITSIGDRSASFFGSNVSVGTSTFISCHATASAEL
jgi:hypothetical protein